MSANTLTMTPRGDRELVITRMFAAPPEMVFDALTRPELIRQWLLGPDGWTMPGCDVDLRAGGKYRYVWAHPTQGEMGMGGEYREVVRPSKIVNTEAWDKPWFPGEAVVTTELSAQDGGTAYRITISSSPEARAAVLASGMETGLAASYDRLEQLLSAPPRV